MATVSPIGKRWFVKTVLMPADSPTWGIPEQFLPRLAELKFIDRGAVTFLQVSGLVEHLHTNDYDTNNLVAAIEKFILDQTPAPPPQPESNAPNQGPNESPNAPNPPTDPYAFNDKWILVAGTWSSKIETNIVSICTELGQLLARGGYGLITGDGQGVDFYVSTAFNSELRNANLDSKPRLQMVLMPKQSLRQNIGQRIHVENNEQWCHYVMSEASAVIMIGGEGGTGGLLKYAREYKVPVIPVPGTGGDVTQVTKELTPDEQLYIPSEPVIKNSLSILDKLPSKRLTEETFRQQVEKIYTEKPITIPDDLQKGRWGKYNTNNKLLEATVSRGNQPGYYQIELSIRSAVNPQAKGQVAFFVHNSFPSEIVYTQMEGGKASIIFEAYEAFTAGAYTEDGTTLELDLNTWTGYPKDFYTPAPPEKFVKKVDELYKQRPPKDTVDLQKGRWGGSSTSNDKHLTAMLRPSPIPGNYNIDIDLVCDNPQKPLRGHVAFFVQNSMPTDILYEQAAGEKASLTLSLRKGFTIGAYTEDDTMLELDLTQFFPRPAP